MKFALVTCPNPQLDVPTAHFPQSLLYVGGALKKAGHEVRIIDLRHRKSVLSTDIPGDIDVVGITATSGEFEWAKRIALIARKKGLKTLIGGAHATFLTKDCEGPEWLFDYIVRRDGEASVVRIVEDTKLGRPRIPSIYDMPLEKLDGYFPDWDLIGINGFSKELFSGAGYGSGSLAAGIISSRGCVFQCSYCRSNRDVVRYRPIDEVVFEIKELKSKWGIQHFRWYDESFTLNKKRCLELLKELEKLDIHSRVHSRSDLWDDELAEACKRAGIDEIGFGFEAASNSVLQKVRKQETVEQHRQAVRVCKRHGIICKAFWMAGLPAQGWPEIQDIKDFMFEERPDKWIISVFSAYPGSDIYSRPEEYGVSWLEKDLSKYWNFPDKPTIAYYDNPGEEIWKQYMDLKLWLEKRFPR